MWRCDAIKVTGDQVHQEASKSRGLRPKPRPFPCVAAAGCGASVPARTVRAPTGTPCCRCGWHTRRAPRPRAPRARLQSPGTSRWGPSHSRRRPSTFCRPWHPRRETRAMLGVKYRFQLFHLLIPDVGRSFSSVSFIGSQIFPEGQLSFPVGYFSSVKNGHLCLSRSDALCAAPRVTGPPSGDTTVSPCQSSRRGPPTGCRVTSIPPWSGPPYIPLSTFHIDPKSHRTCPRTWWGDPGLPALVQAGVPPPSSLVNALGHSTVRVTPLRSSCRCPRQGLPLPGSDHADLSQFICQ